MSSPPPRPEGDGWRLEWVPKFDGDAGCWAGERELDWSRDCTEDETRELCELIARAGLPEHDRAPKQPSLPTRSRPRGRSRRPARRQRKSSSKSDDGEPPGARPGLHEADARYRAHPSGPHFQYEHRRCVACGNEFRNYWADSSPMSACSACCQSCENDGACPECGADTGADRGAE